MGLAKKSGEIAMLYEAPARPMRRLKSRPLQLNRNIVAKAYLAAVLWGVAIEQRIRCGGARRVRLRQ